MSSLSDSKAKNLLLGITGGIAAYKSAILLRHFIKEGWNVRVIMTPAAKAFVGPLTFSTLSKNPVHSETFNPNSGEWTNHVELALWADLFVIAPATANTLAKAAHGIADNLLLITYLSAKCPILWAPAMDLDMHQHEATQKNLNLLQERKNFLVNAEFGELASGLIGQGRMAEPEHIFATAKEIMKGKSAPAKKKNISPKILVTAGPTYEAIDPVRFIGNRSSGKMGFAIANSLAQQGYMVELISGPTNQKISHPSINVTSVESAEEMNARALECFSSCQGAILAAAVADYKPQNYSEQKRKKINGKALDLSLVETKDIALSLSAIKKPKQFIVGFALETENEIENARKKMVKKGFNMIVLNSLADSGAGFQTDTNKVTFLFPNKKSPLNFPLKSKEEVANDIVAELKNLQ